MHAADRPIRIQPGRELLEAGYHARGAGEGDPVVEAQAARPAGQPDMRLELSPRDDTNLAVAAVVQPKGAGVQPRRVGTGQAACDHLSRGAGKHDAALIDRKVAVGRAPIRDLVRRGGEEARTQARAGRDRVELDVIAGEDRPVGGFDAARPPHPLYAAVLADAHDTVLADGVRVEPRADQGEVVDVEAAGHDHRTNREERTIAFEGWLAVEAHVGAVDQPANRRELKNLVWVAGAGQMNDAPLAIDGQARWVGEPQVRLGSRLGRDGQHQVLVFTRHEQRDPVLGQDIPPPTFGREAEQAGLSSPRVAPLADDLRRVAPCGVVARPRRGHADWRASQSPFLHSAAAPQYSRSADPYPVVDLPPWRRVEKMGTSIIG